MTQGLRTFFGSGVGRKDPVGIGFHLEWGFTIPVNTGGGSEDDFVDAISSAALQNIERAVGIGLVVNPGIFHTGTHSGAGGKV